jgi:CheY-like chemotaxis protein
MMEKILIVEDNPQNMRLIEMTLKPKNYTLLKAVDGEEALNLAWSERPDLIIMDVQLPKMSGLEVTRKLRETPVFSHTPIIGLTAYAMKGDKERIIESGCDVYLSKPINTRALPGLITLMLSQEQKPNSSLKGDDNEKEDPYH